MCGRSSLICNPATANHHYYSEKLRQLQLPSELATKGAPLQHIGGAGRSDAVQLAINQASVHAPGLAAACFIVLSAEVALAAML